MKVYLNTSITPEIKIYDTESEGKSSTLSNVVNSILSPVVILRDDSGDTLYTYGDYKPGLVIPFIFLGISAFIIFKFVR